MSIRRRGNSWIVDYRPDGRNGKRVRVHLPASIQDEAQARKIEQDLRAASREAKIKSGPEVSPLATVKELWPHYMNHAEGRQAITTIRDKKGVSKRILLPRFGRMRPSGITTATVDKFQADRAKEVGPRMVNKEIAYLRAFLRWCGRRGVPVASVAWSPLPYRRPLPVIMQPEEVMRFLSACEPFYRTLFMALYVTGARWSEVTRLRWSEVDLDARHITILGKGGKFRRVPIPPALEADFRTMTRTAGWVFPSPVTGRPLNQARKAITRAKKRSGIIKRITPHLFRHSLASHMVSHGVGFRVIQELLGHAHMQTTTWYAQVGTSSLREAVVNVTGVVTVSTPEMQLVGNN